MHSTERKKVAVAIATFNPDRQLLETVVRLSEEAVDTVIVDDASGNDASMSILRSCASAGAHVIMKLENRGIGDSLNAALDWCNQQGYEYFVTLDQDTTLPRGYVHTSLSYFEELQAEGVPVGLVTAGVLNGKLRSPRSISVDPMFSEAIDVMQSGSLLSVPVAIRLGGFREDFVMDCIDADYCLRLRSSGYRIVWHDESEIQHSLGAMAPATLAGRKVRFRGRPVFTSHHSDSRRYYMSRNRIILLREYGRIDSQWFAKAWRAYLKETVVAVLFEPRRTRRIGIIARGTLDGLRGRVGRQPRRAS